MSSILRPNDELLRTFAKKFDHTRIVETIDLPTDSLDALTAREQQRIDVLKVDTQGSELDILEGARTCLGSSVVAAEVEVSFFKRYVDQPLLADIAGVMNDHGFELLDLYRLKRYRRTNSFGIGNASLGGGQRAGRLAYGDAIFLLSEQELERRASAATAPAAEHMVLTSLMAMLAYGKPDMAAHQFDRFADAVAMPLREHLHKWFGRLGARPLGTGIVHHVADWLARHA